jgi:hypothetical protein
MRTVPRWLLAAGAAAAMCGISATSAMASTTTDPGQPPWSTFSDCPTSAPNISLCFYSQTTTGSFTIGNTTVDVGTTPIVFQGGIATSKKGVSSFVPAADGDTLSQVPLTVPGGLLGLTPPNLFPQPLQGIIDAAINSFNGVTATAELVGKPKFNYGAFLTGKGPTVVLPVQIQLSNPFLGSGCFIGSASDPVTLKLTTGKTKPPTGVTPLHGTDGTLSFFDSGAVVVADGDSIVGNTFAAPAASGCGGAFSALVDPVVNAKEGLPSAAGTNSAILNGTSDLASASEVIANGY